MKKKGLFFIVTLVFVVACTWCVGVANMKENICTIPINDIFRETDGCPLCRMIDMVEQQYVEYITMIRSSL